MKLSLITALATCWTSGMIAGLVLSHGLLVLALYSLLLLVVTGAAHVAQHVVMHQLALAEFRQEMNIARQVALAQVSRYASA